jgi:hypothetical protein
MFQPYSVFKHEECNSRFPQSLLFFFSEFVVLTKFQVCFHLRHKFAQPVETYKTGETVTIFENPLRRSALAYDGTVEAVVSPKAPGELPMYKVSWMQRDHSLGNRAVPSISKKTETVSRRRLGKSLSQPKSFTQKSPTVSSLCEGETLFFRSDHWPFN